MPTKPMIKATLCSIVVALFMKGSDSNENSSIEPNDIYSSYVLNKNEIDKIEARHVEGKPYLCQRIVNISPEGKETITLKYFNKDIFVLTNEVKINRNKESYYAKYIFEDVDGDGLIERTQLNKKSYLRGVKISDLDEIIPSRDDLFRLIDPLQQKYNYYIYQFLEDNIEFCK